jgi:hypothetical protein
LDPRFASPNDITMNDITMWASPSHGSRAQNDYFDRISESAREIQNRNSRNSRNSMQNENTNWVNLSPSPISRRRSPSPIRRRFPSPTRGPISRRRSSPIRHRRKSPYRRSSPTPRKQTSPRRPSPRRPSPRRPSPRRPSPRRPSPLFKNYEIRLPELPELPARFRDPKWATLPFNKYGKKRLRPPAGRGDLEFSDKGRLRRGCSRDQHRSASGRCVMNAPTISVRDAYGRFTSQKHNTDYIRTH